MTSQTPEEKSKSLAGLTWLFGAIYLIGHFLLNWW